MWHKVKKNFKTELYLFLFIAISIIFRGGSHFYEHGIYVNYVQSILNDFDFNIINQISNRLSWIITPTFHFPDAHPLTQTPFIAFAYIFEKVSTLITQTNLSKEFSFLLSGIVINFVVFLYSFRLQRRANVEYLKDKYEKIVLLSLFGSTFLYFTCFTVNVIDTFSIPVTTYLLLNFRSMDPKENSKIFFFALGLGFLVTIKIFFIPLVLFWGLSKIIDIYKEKNYKGLVILLVAVALPIILAAVNSWVKYGSFILESNYVARVLFDYSFSHLAKKIFIGFFGPGGFFFLNPLLLMGLFCFAWSEFVTTTTKDKLFTTKEFLAYSFFLGFVFFHPIFMLGTLVEDLLPGRATLISLPFLTLAIAHTYKHSPNKKNWQIAHALVLLWNVFIIFNFIIFDSYDTFSYYKTKFVFLSEIEGLFTYYTSHIQNNFNIYAKLLPAIVILILLFKVAITLFRKVAGTICPIKTLLSLWLIIFIPMTAMNMIYTPKNIEIMKRQNAFAGKVIGNGLDIYMYDYILDRFNSVSLHSDGALDKELDERAKVYYETIESQVIKSIPEFDARRKEKVWKSIHLQ